MTVKISRTRATVKDEAGCKQRGFCGFVCLSFQLLCQLKYHQLKNTEHSLRSNGVGGTFEQWSNKNKIQRDHTLGTLWHKSLSQSVSAGWLNKCCCQGKADQPTVYRKSSHALVLSFWNTMGKWKVLQCCDKMECCISLKIFCTQYASVSHFAWFEFCWHDLKAFQNGSLPRHSLKVQTLPQKQVKFILPHVQFHS